MCGVQITANVGMDEKAVCMEAGMDGYLTKPVRGLGGSGLLRCCVAIPAHCGLWAVGFVVSPV